MQRSAQHSFTGDTLNSRGCRVYRVGCAVQSSQPDVITLRSSGARICASGRWLESLVTESVGARLSDSGR
eukprot:8424897-Alexandrium_andersonii.AAC.1